MPWQLRLLREVHAAEEVLEARVRAEGIKGRQLVKPREQAVAVLKPFQQPLDGLIMLPQPDEHDGDQKG